MLRNVTINLKIQINYCNLKQFLILNRFIIAIIVV